jgi:predicted DNA-binding protein
MSPAKGRPPSKNPKRNDTRIRLSDEEWEKLSFCAEKTGMTKTDIIRKGINLVYQEVTKK